MHATGAHLASRSQPRRLWKILTPAAMLAAGALFATSAQTARGTDLRSPQTADLVGTVRSAVTTVDTLDHAVTQLQAQVNTAAAAAGQGNTQIAALQQQISGLTGPFGLTALTGPGLVAVLDDAPSPAATDPSLRGGQTSVSLDQLVIHQSDLQAVVNAMWAGGAEAVAIGDQRLVPTSAVRCVGNTLLLNGKVYSPPFRVTAIGRSVTMKAALDRSDGVTLLKQAASYYGVGYTVSPEASVSVPAYTGRISLSFATPR